MAPSGAAYNTDWIWASGTNVHVANHLDWFTNYSPFKTKVNSGMGEIEVDGVGSVVLRLAANVKGGGPQHDTIIELDEVLYVPGSSCNIIGNPIFDNYGIGGSLKRMKLSKNGTVIGHLDSNVAKLLKLRLHGQASGTTSFEPNRPYWIHSNWSKSERDRWAAVKYDTQVKEDVEPPAAHTQEQQAMDTKGSDDDELPYSAEERRWFTENWQKEKYFLKRHGLRVWKPKERAAGRKIARAMMVAEARDVKLSLDGNASYKTEEKTWLKDHYGGEYTFLGTQGLSIYADEDRAEGRRIARAMMNSDEDKRYDSDGDGSGGLKSEGSESEDDGLSKFERDLEEDPSSHFADYHFSHEQLDWIEEHYGHSGSFLISHGLKFYDDEDCKQGVSIVKAMMEH